MFKDYNKYLRESLKVYIFVLAIIVILKLIGFDYFGLDVTNKNFIEVSKFLVKTHLADLINCIAIYIQFYFYLCIVCNKKKLYLWAFIGAFINIASQVILMRFESMHFIYYIVSCIVSIALPMIVNKRFFIKKQIKYSILITIYQMFSLLIRNVNIKYEYGNFIVDSILNLDQLLMLAINYNVYFMRGGNEICGQEQEAGSSLQKKINLKNLRQRLHTKWQDKSKEDKISLIIYVVLSFIWNLLNLAIILIVAKLNNTLVECIFILTSFWLSKRSFGKAFHLSSMTHCFVVSNLTYYLLNRITTPIGISIVIPVLLGVGLSYITSKFVKKIYKPLYRGMPIDLFNETILRVVDKESHKYNVCYEYYIDMRSAVSLSMKYHYSEDGIRQICKRINEKIKRLN